MAWTHYTANLNPGEILTAAMWGELIDALDERIQAAGQSGDGITDKAALKAAGLGLRAIPYRFLGADGSATAYGIAAAIAWRYARTNAAITSESGYLAADVAADLGITTGLISAAISAAGSQGLDSAHLWNIARSAIRILKYPVRPFASRVAWEKYAIGTHPSQFSAIDWATVRDACIADTEYTPPVNSFFGDAYAGAITGGDYDGGLGGYYKRAYGIRHAAEVTIPNLPIFSGGFAAWVFLEGAIYDSRPTDKFLLDVGAASFVIDEPSASPEKVSLGTLSEVGTLTTNFRRQSYADAAKLDLYEPAFEDGKAGAAYLAGYYDGTPWLFTEPVFTHP